VWAGSECVLGAISRQAAVVRSHVGAILAVVAIDVDRLGTGTGGMLGLGEDDRAESGKQEKQNAAFPVHRAFFLLGDFIHAAPV